MWTSLFWKDLTERALATAAQVLIALLSVDGLNLVSLDVNATASAVGIAVVLVVLKAIVAAAAVGRSVSPASLAPDDRGI